MHKFSFGKGHKQFSCNMTCWFIFSLLIHKRCIENTTVFVCPCFRCGMQKEIRTEWNRAVQRTQGKNKTTKNLLQTNVSSVSLLNSGSPETFHNELTDQLIELKSSGTPKDCWKWPNAKICIRGSLWKLVQCVTLLTSCKDFCKQPPNFLEYLAEYVGGDVGGGWGLTKKKQH